MPYTPTLFEDGAIIQNGLAVTGNSSIVGSLQISGDLQVSGNLTYSQTSYGDIIASNSGYKLGNTSIRWGVNATFINSTGLVNIGASTANGATLNLAPGTSPVSPASGDIWATANSLYSFSGGVSRPLAFADGVIALANAATVLATARTINLTGDATGNVVFNGGSNANITVVGVNSAALNGQPASYYLNANNFTGTVPVAVLSGSYNISISGVANNTVNFNGQGASYYLNANNFTGILPTGVLSGIYAASITGNANTATNANNSAYLNGQTPAYYLNANNHTGTLPDNVLPASMSAKTLVALAVTNGITANTLIINNGLTANGSLLITGAQKITGTDRSLVLQPNVANTSSFIGWNRGNGNIGWGLGYGDGSYSSFNLYRYDLTGAYIDNPMGLSASTGALTLTQRPSWAGYIPYDSGNFNPSLYPLTVNGVAPDGNGNISAPDSSSIAFAITIALGN